MKKSGIFALLILIFVVAACNNVKEFVSKLESKSNSNSAQNNNSTQNSVKPSGNPRDDIIKASKKFSEQDAFQTVLDGKGKKDFHLEVEYIAPDRYHLKYPNGSEFLIIGKDTYLKANGNWKKSPANLNEAIPKMKEAFTEDAMKSLKDVEYVGEESVDGKSAFLYRYKGKTEKDANAYNSKIWIGKDDGLPMKIEVEYPAGGDLKEMTTTYKYDKNVKIEAPNMK